jgi:hypothetical protein
VSHPEEKVLVKESFPSPLLLCEPVPPIRHVLELVGPDNKGQRAVFELTESVRVIRGISGYNTHDQTT